MRHFLSFTSHNRHSRAHTLRTEEVASGILSCLFQVFSRIFTFLSDDDCDTYPLSRAHTLRTTKVHVVFSRVYFKSSHG